MAEGWISIHRKLQECWIWNGEPFTRGQAWVDILLSATHNDFKKRIGNSLVTIQSGQLHTSILKLSQRWKWSEKKVRRFLELLKSDGMITYEGTAHGTTLTIVNYGFYQGEGRTVDTPNDLPNDRTGYEQTTEQGTNTRPTYNNDNNKNNDNKDNNENKSIRVKFTPPTLEDVSAYVYENNINIDPEAFFDHFTSNGWLVGGKTKMKDWKAAVRNWERNERKWNNDKPSNGGNKNRKVDWDII